jgi:hypothetical protein
MAFESVACADDPARPNLAPRAFDFTSDTFSYPNELVWEYRFDCETGKPSIQKQNPPPTYAHHCFVVVRSAKQFFLHAAFEPGAEALEPDAYAPLVREVVRRSPSRASSPEARVRIPGFPNLRKFSAEQADTLKSNCGGAWQSYFQRGNWRMVLPFTRGHQEREALALAREVDEKHLPIVHVVTFPRLTINHVLMLTGCVATESRITFRAYDPNIPAHPVEIVYQRESRRFEYPRTHYFTGGAVNLYEIYRGLWL